MRTVSILNQELSDKIRIKGSLLTIMARGNYSIDLIRQMAECDANYIRLLKLVPQLQAYKDRSFIEYALQPTDRLDQSPAQHPTLELEPEKHLEGLASEFCIAERGYDEENVTVTITILEAFKYTTTLEIIQKPEFRQWMTNPSMLVRVYHDASTAEVISYQGHRNLQARYAQPNPSMYHADEKMQVNQFLGEWLTHCLNVGRSLKKPDLLLNS